MKTMKGWWETLVSYDAKSVGERKYLNNSIQEGYVLLIDPKTFEKSGELYLLQTDWEDPSDPNCLLTRYTLRKEDKSYQYPEDLLNLMPFNEDSELVQPIRIEDVNPETEFVYVNKSNEEIVTSGYLRFGDKTPKEVKEILDGIARELLDSSEYMSGEYNPRSIEKKGVMFDSKDRINWVNQLHIKSDCGVVLETIDKFSKYNVSRGFWDIGTLPFKRGAKMNNAIHFYITNGGAGFFNKKKVEPKQIIDDIMTAVSKHCIGKVELQMMNHLPVQR